MRKFWKWVKRRVFRSSVTGKFVSAKEAKENPRETVKDTIQVKGRK